MMTPQKHLFVKHYLICLNATKAAILAGYSEKTAGSQGQRLLKDVEISALIEEARKKTAEKLDITRESQLEALQEIKSKCMQDEPVLIRDQSGMMVESGEYKFEGRTAIAAIQEQNKMLGFDKPKGNKNSGQPINVTFEVKTSRDES